MKQHIVPNRMLQIYVTFVTDDVKKFFFVKIQQRKFFSPEYSMFHLEKNISTPCLNPYCVELKKNHIQNFPAFTNILQYFKHYFTHDYVFLLLNALLLFTL